MAAIEFLLTVFVPEFGQIKYWLRLKADNKLNAIFKIELKNEKRGKNENEKNETHQISIVVAQNILGEASLTQKLYKINKI